MRLSIVQPRLDNISTFECSREELEQFGEKIKPIAKLAYEGKGEQKTGDWCQFCRARATCQACVDEAMALAKEEFVDLDSTPKVAELDSIVKILPTLERISHWIDDVFAFVTSEAINNGTVIKGYKVVEGTSRRAFTDTDAVVKVATENGFDDIYTKKLIGIPEFEKMMGKKKFAELLGKYVMKPPGKLSLVVESDKRTGLSPEEIKNKKRISAEDDFASVED